MNKFRASFTVLNIWKSGDWERAVKTYFKLEKFITPAMATGKEFHENWCKEIQENKKLPVVFGAKELTAPICEEKAVVQLAPWLELVGIIDCYDSPTIYEFKSGKQSSEVYANSMQPGMYGVLATLSGKLVKSCEIYHYDQYSKKSDMSVVWLTDKILKDAENWIVTLGGEMHQYFETNDLYNKFGEHK